MSVILRGKWRIPKKCLTCLFCKQHAPLADGTKNEVCKVAVKMLDEGDTPYDPKGAGRFCPLVELPEKHGRLIDADAFAEHMRESAELLGMFAPLMATALEGAIRDLKDPKKTPTIVEAEGEEVEK